MNASRPRWVSLATLRGAPHVYIPGYPVVGRQGAESGLSVSARGTFGIGLRPLPNLPPACRLTAPTADTSIPLFSAPCTTAHCPPPTPFFTLAASTLARFPPRRVGSGLRPGLCPLRGVGLGSFWTRLLAAGLRGYLVFALRLLARSLAPPALPFQSGVVLEGTPARLVLLI